MNIEKLREYNVPETVITVLKERGFLKLTEVQKLAIERGLFEGKNLVTHIPHFKTLRIIF